MQTTIEGVMAVGDESSAASQLAQAAGESIGRVEAVQGNVTITRTDGTTVDAQSGTEIFQGDTVTTDDEGSIGLVFADNSTFSLAEGGEMVIDEMIYDPGTEEGNALFQVASGVFTFASGQIAKTGVDAMKIATPTATIGIRGTSGAVRIGKDGPDTYTLLEDVQARSEAGIKGQAADDVLLAQAAGSGQAGGMTVTNQVGSQTLTQINETTQISSPFSPPTLPVILPAAAVARAFASARALLPPPPVTTPAGGGNQGGDEGDNQGGPDPDAAPVADPQEAAAEAFDEALAEGGTLEDAMAAAAGAATEAVIQNTLAGDPLAFGTAGAINGSMDAIGIGALGGLGAQALDPLGAGDGGGNMFDRSITGGNVVTGEGLQETFEDIGRGLFGGGDPEDAGPGEFLEIFNFIFEQVLEEIVEQFEEELDDIISEIGPDPTKPTVDINISGSETHDLLDTQNDNFIGSSSVDTLTLNGTAQAGDFFSGGGILLINPC